MPRNISRRLTRRDTRRLLFWTAIVAIVLLAGVTLWPVLFHRELVSLGLPRGAQDRSANNSTTGTFTDQGAGESQAGKQPSASPSSDASADDPGTRAREITGSGSGATSVSPEQREKISSYMAQHPDERLQTADFSISVGAAVPRQVPLRDIPPELSDALPEYQGQQYIVVGDQLVVVDKQSRRIVAIIPTSA